MHTTKLGINYRPGVKHVAQIQGSMQLKKSRYVHSFLQGERCTFFHSLTLGLFHASAEDFHLLESFAEERSAELSPQLQELLEVGLLVVNADDQPGQALAKLRDKRLAAKADRGGSIGFLRVSLTERCNMGCTYCFQQKLFEDYQPVMSQERFREIMEWFIGQNTGGQPTVQYFGGEPLLKMDLIRLGNEILRQAVAEGRIKGYEQNMTTNGTLLTDEIAQYFAENRFDIVFSLDGWKELNDEFRVFKNGRGTYDEVVRAIETYRRFGGRVSILITPRHDNVTQLPEIVKHCVTNLGAAQIGLNAPQPTPLGWQADGAALAQSVQEIWDYCADRGVDFHSIGGHVPKHIENELSQVDRCIDSNLGGDRGDWPAYVSADGQVSFCVVHHRDDDCTAPASDGLVDTEKFRQWHYDATDHPECDECIASQICGGPCSLELKFRDGQLNPDRCAFFKSMVEWVVKK